MESIHEVELGSNRKCAEVCFVKNPRNFWVRFDEHKDDYYQLIKSLQSEYSEANESKEYDPAHLVVGSAYCIFNQKLFEWHRCEILRINERDALVFYTDIGTKDLMPIKALKTLKDEYKKTNRFAVNCALDNIRSLQGAYWSQSSIRSFHEKVLGKIVTLTFKSKSETVFNVEMFLKTQNMAQYLIEQGIAEERDESSTEIQPDGSPKVELQCSRFLRAAKIPISNESQFEVEVTTIYSPYCFYAQLCKDKNEFYDFEESLQEYCTSSLPSNETIKKPRVGQMCIAKYSVDDAWYRAVIKEVDHESNTVKVFFVDYGNDETIQIEDNLKVINEKFVKHPCIGILCCLDKIQPVNEDLNNAQKLEEIVNFMYESMESRVLATFVAKQTDSCYKVKLSVESKTNEGKSKFDELSDLLIEKQYALKASNEKLTKPVHSKLIKVKREKASNDSSQSESKMKQYPKNEPLIEKNQSEKKVQTLMVTITHIETISEFYIKVQKTRDEDEIRALMKDIQYFYQKKVNLPQPSYKVGAACVFYDDEKKIWYRAEITHLIDVNHCIVRLVDYGQSKYVHKSFIRDIYEKYLTMPCQVAEASLSDLSDQVDEILNNKFKEIALNRNFLAKICDVTELSENKQKYMLNLFDETNESVFQLLIQDHEPSGKSKLEESTQSVYDTTLVHNNTTLGNLTLNNSELNGSVCHNNPETEFVKPKREQRDYSSQDKRSSDIHDDPTSPFPVHEVIQNNNKDKVDHQIQKNIPIFKPVLQPSQKSPEISQATLEILKNSVTNHKTTSALVVEQKRRIFNYFKFQQPNPKKQYSLTVSHFETINKLFSQIVDWFDPFADHHDDFQTECDNSTQKLLESDLVDSEDFKTLAIAAKFVEDEVWYRGRIINQPDSDKNLLIQFVDYGNTQSTPIDKCILLNRKFTEFIPAVVECAGVAYLNGINEKMTENLLCYNKVDVNDNDLNHYWSHVFLQQTPSGYMLEIDELYKFMYTHKLIDRSFSFKPAEMNEPICQQANKNEINESCSPTISLNSKVFEATVTDLSLGLRYIFLNLKQSMPALEELQKQLDEETNDSLIRLEITDLHINSLYLVKYKSKLCRCILFTSPSKDFYQIQLVDYGNRVIFKETDNIEFYVMMTKYFKHNTFALHCRLPFATSIEKVWLEEESNKFYHQIQANKDYKIKILNAFEPYILEFVDDKQKIDFEFTSIIKRINQNDLESQTIPISNYPVSLDDEFYLAGQFLLEQPRKRMEFFIDYHQKTAKDCCPVYVHSKSILEQIKKLNKFLKEHVEQPKSRLLTTDLLKKGELILVKPTDENPLLSILKENIASLIRNEWSRVQVTSIESSPAGEKMVTLFYSDYGFETINEIETLAKNYSFAQMPVQFKIWPAFIYECELNKNTLLAKLTEAKIKNEFIDTFYLNEFLFMSFKKLASMSLKVDFTEALKQMSRISSAVKKYPIDIINPARNENFIDTIIRNSLLKVSNHTFQCVISHVFLYNDFYVQREDPFTAELLDNLQISIQEKVDQMKTMQTLELNKLCIALFDEDGQYYRAKIVGFSNETDVEVYFVDYGNSTTVSMANMKEISAEFIDDLPKYFCINCEQKLNVSELSESELREFNDYFLSIIEEFIFDVKYIEQKSEKYQDTTRYVVQMVESESKLNVLELFKKSKQETNTEIVTEKVDSIPKVEEKEAIEEPEPEIVEPEVTSEPEIVVESKPEIVKPEIKVEIEPVKENKVEKIMRDNPPNPVMETSNVNFKFNFTIDLNETNCSSGDDRALAESITNYNDQTKNDETNCNVTAADLLVTVSDIGDTSVKPLVANLPNPSNDSTSSWNETNASLRNYNYNPYDTNLTANMTINDSIFNESRAHISNVESTKNDLSILDSEESEKLSKSKEDEQMKLAETEIEKEIKEIEQESDADHTINEADIDRDDELYSTANTESMILAENADDTLEQSSCLTFSTEKKDAETEWLTFNECMIAFMASTQNFYIQFKDFYEKIEEIQPIVDDCLDPFDLSVTPLCVGQFQEDELFYRCRVTNWVEDSETVTVSFIDFGNTENILTETVTAMAPELMKIKPLVVRCRFDSDINPECASFKNFEKIVVNECKLTLKIKKSDYDEYNEALEKGSEPIHVKLFLESGLEVNENTLKDDKLWNFEEPEKVIDQEKLDEEADDTKNSNLDVSEALNKLGEVTYLQKLEGKEDETCDEFNGHDTKWFEKSNASTLQQTGIENDTVSQVDQSKAALKNEKPKKSLKRFSPEGGHEENEQSYIENQNGDVSKFHDQSSQWQSNETIGHSLNDTTANSNEEVSRFHDQSSKWLVTNDRSCNNTLDDADISEISDSSNSSQVISDSKNYSAHSINNTKNSVWESDPDQSTHNMLYTKNTNQKIKFIKDLKESMMESTHNDTNNSLDQSNCSRKGEGFENEQSYIENQNKDASRFHDESSQWKSNETLGQSLNETTANYNKDVSKYHDNDSNWSISDSTLSDSSVNQTLDHNNKDVSRFHDQYSQWKSNETLGQSLNETLANYNKDVSRFHDQSTKWIPDNDQTISDQTIDHQNKDVQRFLDQSSQWTVDTLDDTETTHSINNTKGSVWNSDPDQSTHNMLCTKNTKKKIQLLDELFELSQRLSFTEDDDTIEDIDYSQTFDGFILKVNSLGNFYIQGDNADELLMNMKSDLDKCRKPFDKSPISVGTFCVAPDHVDNQYYRAQVVEVKKSNILNSTSFNNTNTSFNSSIIKMSENRVKVLYIDYGTESYVDSTEIYRITSELIKTHEPLAFRCQLNLNKKINTWLNNLKDLNEDVTDQLVKSFKSLTSKSKLKVNVIKREMPTNEQPAPTLVVDLFIGDENICNLLIENTINCLKQDKISTEINMIKKENDFNGIIINYKPIIDDGAKFAFECNIQNELVLDLVNELSTSWNDLNASKPNDGDSVISMANIPDFLVKALKIKPKHGRVAIRSSNAQQAVVNFIDYDYQCLLNLSEIISMNTYINKNDLPSSMERISMDLKNIKQLSTLKTNQKRHLNEIFTCLINNRIINDSKFSFGFSSKLLIRKTRPHVFRLFDASRENLDINCVIDMCISIISYPFQGYLSSLESDYSNFDCINKAAMSEANQDEMEKIYRSNAASLAKLKDNDSDFKQFRFQIGQLCLIDETPTDSSPRKLAPNTESILIIDDEYVNRNEEEKVSNLKQVSRGIIIDESSEKCVVQNLDNGKKLTLKKKRIYPVSEKLQSDSGLKLIQILPCMIIKAKPNKPVTCSSVKRTLKNSRYYCEIIDLNIIGSWTPANSVISNQSNLGLYKLVSFNTGSFTDTIALDNEINHNASILTGGSSIEVINTKPKIVEIELKLTEPTPVKVETIKPVKQTKTTKKTNFFTLSYMNSLNLFYLHSSDSLKNVAFIEEFIQNEMLSNRSVRKLDKKSPTLQMIYGVYNENKGKYFRVRLLSRVLVVPVFNQSKTEDELYIAFYIDFGYTEQVKSKDLIFISDAITQMAPQAICCKLHGFGTSKTSFENAELDSENKENTFHTDTSNSSINQINNDEDLTQASALFSNIMDKKPFMATAYKRFNTSKKIDNRLPLQTDNNSRPIEIVIHLFHVNEFENVNVSVNENYIDEINENKANLKFRNVCYILKLLLDVQKNNLSRKSPEYKSIEKFFYTQSTKITRFNLKKHLTDENEIHSVTMGHLIDPNHFFMKFDSISLSANLEKDYNQSLGLNLNELELINGKYCAYINREQGIYKRAKIISYQKKTKKCCVYLIDSGRFVETNVENMFALLNNYYAIEPLCFECTFGLKYKTEHQEVLINYFKSQIKSYKEFKIKLIETIDEEKALFLIDLFGRANTGKYDPSIRKCLASFYQESFPEEEKLKKSDLKCFTENDLPLNKVLKIQLTNLDSIKHFGVVANEEVEKRWTFLVSFHRWYRENRKTLKPLFDVPKKTNIGQPCAINSIQFGKWCRGVVITCDLNASMSTIYLVDHCRTAQVTNDRVFKIENINFLTEPVYAHRGKLIEDSEQRLNFEKYLDLLKTDMLLPTPLSMKTTQNENLNSSHIAMENIEIEIICLSSSLTPLTQMTVLRSNHYTIKIVDYRRIRQTFPISPFQNISNQSMKTTQQKISLKTKHITNLQQDSMVSLSLTSSSFGTTLDDTKNPPSFMLNDTAENILCADGGQPRLMLKKDIRNLSTNEVYSVASNIKNLNEGEQSINILNYTNEASFTNFSAVTESTRITPKSQNNTIIDNDVTQTNDISHLTSTMYNADNKPSLISNVNRILIDKRGETSNWIKDCDDDNISIMSRQTDLEPGGKMVRVRIIPNTFSPSDFICQKLDVIEDYEMLQRNMNSYYQTIENQSLFDPSMDDDFYQESLMDSMEKNDKSSQKENETQMLLIGDYCAVKIKNDWQRAKITDINSNRKMAHIECVDDCRKLNVEVKRLEKLASNFFSMKKFAFRCKLSGLNSSKLLTFNPVAIEKFKRIISEENKELMAEIVEVKEEDSYQFYEINLYIDNKNITDWLLAIQ